MEFAQGETSSSKFMRFSFAQLHQSMHGQWQRCYDSTFMRYLFIIIRIIAFSFSKLIHIISFPKNTKGVHKNATSKNSTFTLPCILTI